MPAHASPSPTKTSGCRARVARLAETLKDSVLLQCDASDDDQIQAVFDAVGDQMGSLSVLVHSIAFASRENLGGRLADTGETVFA